MENTTQRPEHALPGLIRKVLGSPHSEQVIKAQIIQMASQNLHVPEVTTALLEVLPLTKDKETRDQLLRFLSALNTSRFADTAPLFQALLDVYKQEKDRDTRTALLYRLQDSIHQDPRLAVFFVELSGQETLSEQERIAVQDTLSSLPAISEEVALSALLKNVNAPTILQLQAVEIAEKCPSWSAQMVAGLQPYLDVKNDRGIRFRILQRLAAARLLEAAYADVLIPVLRTDNDVDARHEALTALSRIKPWNEAILLQLLWSASHDGDASIRSQALQLQGEQPERTNEQLISMAGLLATDRSEGVRLTLLQQLKPMMRIAEIRNSVATAFAGNPGVFNDEEFNQLTDMLAPYAGRDEQISQLLLQSIKDLPSTAQRQKVLQLLIGKISLEKMLDPVVQLFTREHNETLREVLFNQIKALSVSRHPQLVDVFCAELTEPGSPFRVTCAGILANAAELYPQIPPALEDVLLYDNDRELVRLALDGYLRPGVEKKFDILINVVKNELADTGSRQKALDAVLKLSLDEQQQETLANALSGLKPGTLKTS
ncbi:HEAT repeat domain-containing protein [Chitinophaga qingshengii]|uniref:HEAT repeat domain-containing protein n=1 Tax=Chitinophaga qingshengii TaxID=1569794 RepID=A0ABR7TWU9_9BACT|nr:HEAT repeat domain-containing protein [Chitinophaga qingshengii]MBC9934956.1 HEAT repeat domain-containing protein [Chitinophaga qingshengii]